ncbi:MAG TPA: type II toxin-antitoxin system RelE/ParE family toxin [Thermoanaerobaculia bacterium]
MSFPIVIRPPAERDLLEAQNWYRQKRLGLGAQFRSSVEEVFKRLTDFPLAFPKVLGEVRRAAVPHFPYILYYAFRRDQIFIIGCFHARRDPRLVLRRISNEE